MPSGSVNGRSPAWINRFRSFLKKEIVLFDEAATQADEVDEFGLTYTIVPYHVFNGQIGPSVFNDTGYMQPIHVYTSTMVNN